MKLQGAHVANPAKLGAVEALGAYRRFLSLPAHKRQELEKKRYLRPLCIIAYLLSAISFVSMVVTGLLAANNDLSGWWPLSLLGLSVVSGSASSVWERTTPCKEEYKFQKHLGRGNIVEVPSHVVEAVNKAAGEIPGLTAWSEWLQHQYAAIVSLIGTAAHILQPLRDNCKCFDLRTCDHVTRLEEATVASLLVDLDKLARAELVPHADAYTAHMRGIQEARASYNALLRGEQTPPPPPLTQE